MLVRTLKWVFHLLNRQGFDYLFDQIMKLLCDVFVELFLLFGLVQRLLIGIRIGEMVAVFIILVAIYVYGFGVDVIQDR